jgi:Protein of unknown function (DUF3606)
MSNDVKEPSWVSYESVCRGKITKTVASNDTTTVAEQNCNSALVGHVRFLVMLTSSSTKRARNRVDISRKELARLWCKRLKKSKAEIEAAIAKVGDNAETVMKELGAKRT